MSAGQPWDESVRARWKARWTTRDHLDPGPETANSASHVTTSAKSSRFLRVFTCLGSVALADGHDAPWLVGEFISMES